MQNTMIYSTAMTLIIASGVGHRWISGDWNATVDDLQLAANRLEAIPARMGDWSGDDMELDKRQIERSGIHRYLSRKYVNRTTGSVVHLLIVCGRPGPISVHSPEVCMQGAGYGLAAEPTAYRIATGPNRPLGQFRTGDFTRQTQPTAETMRVFWGWTSGDGWDAPESPRLEYAGESALYKVYVSRWLDRQDVPIDNDPCVHFLKELLPLTQRAFREGDRVSEKT